MRRNRPVSYTHLMNNTIEKEVEQGESESYGVEFYLSKNRGASVSYSHLLHVKLLRKSVTPKKTTCSKASLVVSFPPFMSKAPTSTVA